MAWVVVIYVVATIMKRCFIKNMVILKNIMILKKMNDHLKAMQIVLMK